MLGSFVSSMKTCKWNGSILSAHQKCCGEEGWLAQSSLSSDHGCLKVFSLENNERAQESWKHLHVVPISAPRRTHRHCGWKCGFLGGLGKGVEN